MLPDPLPPEGERRAQSALARLATALGPRVGHVVVTAATAKDAEALLWRVETEMVAYRAFWVSGRTLDAAHLLRAFAADDPMAESLPAAVQTLLGKARSVGRPVVIVVTEADAAAAGELERLRLLVECTPDAPEVLRLVLLGGPALLEILRRPEVRALSTRITSVVATSDETVTTPLPLTAQMMTAPLDGPTRGGRPWRIVGAGLLGSALAVSLIPLLMAAQGRSRPDGVPAPTVAPAEAPGDVAERLEPPAPPPAAAVEPEPAPPPAAPATAAPATLPPPRAIVHSPPAAAPRLRSVQVGAFRDLARATILRNELAETFEWVMVTDVERDGITLHRVRIEGLASQAAVDAALTKLRRAGHHPILVRP